MIGHNPHEAMAGVHPPSSQAMTERLARRNDAVELSGIRVMFAFADEISDAVNLGIGQPDFETPSFIREAAKEALDQGYTRYPPAKGFEDLREAVAEKLARENRISADPATEVFISVGAMQGIFNTILHLVDPGDEVVVVDPGYDYYSQIRLFGGVPVRVPAREENSFRVDTADVEAAVSAKTKLIIINSPANPTGAVLNHEQLFEIAAIAEKHQVFVLSDEAYEHIVFEDRRHISIASIEGMEALAISVFTLSKSYAMTGWRVGYVTGPRFVIDEMEKLMEHQVSGVTAVAQRAALAAITGPQDCIIQMRAEYARRRARVHEALNEVEGVSCVEPEGAFYAFPNVSRLGLTSWDLAKYLVRKNKVALVPGSIFGRNGEGFLRLSFGAGGRDLRAGLARLQDGLTSLSRRSGAANDVSHD